MTKNALTLKNKKARNNMKKKIITDGKRILNISIMIVN